MQLYIHLGSSYVLFFLAYFNYLQCNKSLCQSGYIFPLITDSVRKESLATAPAGFPVSRSFQSEGQHCLYTNRGRVVGSVWREERPTTTSSPQLISRPYTQRLALHVTCFFVHYSIHKSMRSYP